MEYNEQSFCTEDVKKGLHLDFIKTLIDMNMKSDKYYNDIHITTDGETLIVQWNNVPYSHEWGGRFQYVDEDQVVMTECILPDNSTVMCYGEEDVKETLEKFLKENPSYYKNEYGIWRNRCEDEDLRTYLAKKNKD